MYIMKKLDDVMVVKAESQLFIPSDVCEFEDSVQTLESLMKFKVLYIRLPYVAISATLIFHCF